MSSDFSFPTRLPMIRLLGVAFDHFSTEHTQRVAAAGYPDIRPGHGCVFGGIDPENGSRLTDLADRAMMTKQTVGEVVSDLEKRGYVERVPDPEDGRAKIIRLTAQGREVYLTGWQLNDELEKEWAARFGEDRVAALREALELVHAKRFAGIAPPAPRGEAARS
jgi:DNA-binding MarR family transcriptional regulator